MPLPNGQIGVKENPLKYSPFTLPIETGVNFAPPVSGFMILESGDYMITEFGYFMITE
jgi:hypothetical protein